MYFDVITIFPEALESYLSSSILKRAQAKRLIQVRIHNLRDFTRDKHKTVALRQGFRVSLSRTPQGNREPRRTIDDKPYGGGPGMVMKVEPLAKAVSRVLRSGSKRTKIILFAASGRQFTAAMARQWAKEYKRLILVAGHYEGVDERIKNLFRMEEISIGPYVLTGGELPALVVIDAMARHIPGVLGKEVSLEEKRHGVGVPMYTRPEVFLWKGMKYRVPKVLLSGDHKKIEEWRRAQRAKTPR